MARPAWSAPTTSASAAMLVVSIAVSASLSSSEPNAHTASAAPSLLVLH
jgi:hypothetical protein